MSTFQANAAEFLAGKRIAVVGASGSQQKTGNAIYKALRKRGYQTYAINPGAETIEGDKAYPDIASVPEQLDGVMIVTKPAIADEIMPQCVQAKVPMVWMHENAMFGAAASSVSSGAAELGRENGITVIAGGCPMMFLDFGHKCMRWILGAAGKLPKD